MYKSYTILSKIQIKILYYILYSFAEFDKYFDQVRSVKNVLL